MKRLQLYSLFILNVFALSNCYKQKLDNPYGLPNATQNGSMIFAGQMNGKNFIVGWFDTRGNITKDSVRISASFGHNFYNIIYICLHGKIETNHPYDLSDSINTVFQYGTDSTCSAAQSFSAEVFTASGALTFTRLDSVKRVISGLFSFRVPMPECDTLNFTSGRFDFIY